MYMLGLRSTLLDVLRFRNDGLTPTPITSRDTCETFPTICEGDLFCSKVIDGEAKSLVLVLFSKFLAPDSTNAIPCAFRSVVWLGLKAIR
jgi:hypothetical protein